MNPACLDCPYLSVCAGDCLKHRGTSLDDPKRLSYLCEGWKSFFAHALPELRRIARRIGSSRARQTSPGRNDPCPCGSGKKYKACCGAS